MPHEHDDEHCVDCVHATPFTQYDGTTGMCKEFLTSVSKTSPACRLWKKAGAQPEKEGGAGGHPA